MQAAELAPHVVGAVGLRGEKLELPDYVSQAKREGARAIPGYWTFGQFVTGVWRGIEIWIDGRRALRVTAESHRR